MKRCAEPIPTGKPKSREAEMDTDTVGVDRSAPAKLIPARVKEAREARGYTLEGFAEALGVTKSAVAQYRVRPDITFW